MVATCREALDRGYHTNQTILSNYRPPFETNWKPYKGTKWNENDDTRLPLETAAGISGASFARCRQNFKLHPRVGQDHAGPAPHGGRQAAARLGHGRNCSLTRRCSTKAIRSVFPGQDSGRGTFFHRHAVLHDQNRERWDQGIYIPLQHLGAEPGRFRRDRFAAVRGGGAGLRVRLCHLRAERTRHLGGAIRRFRQRRAGRDRPVHRLRRGQMGAHVPG